ncbi:MAG: isochorismatase family protein [Xanthobacteraceae bacterium]
MLTIDPQRSVLLVIDFQSRLMPVIHDGDIAVRKAGRLIDAAKLFDIPLLVTEQNPKGLGSTVKELPVEHGRLIRKQSFGACREDGFLDHIPADAHVVAVGCESRVCVLQTVLGLLHASRRTFVVKDAIGSRHPGDKEAAIRRMERHGAEIVTTEMVVFEWLRTADHPQFRQAITLIK